MRAAQTHDVPIAFGVLTTNTADEAMARSIDGPANKGREAALAAVSMARLYQTIAGRA
jgi:6,7-dimethyl-8-ribityllumazine synthase